MTAIINDFSAIRSAVDGAPKAGDDSAILALFREWCEAVRYSERDFDEESESEAACARVYGIEDAISDIAATGAAGFAVKIYIRSRTDHAVAVGDPCGLGAGYMEEMEASIFRDACRFVPELAPLCAAVLESEDEDEEEAEGEADHPAIFRWLEPLRRALPAALQALKEGSRSFEEIAIEFYVACGLPRQEALEAAKAAREELPADDPAGDDADLLAAARKIAALQEREAMIYREYAGRMTMEIEQRLVIDALDPDRFAAEAIIYATPPQTLAGAAVKLRAIAAYCDDAAVGEGDVASLRQVLALIERAAQP